MHPIVAQSVARVRQAMSLSEVPHVGVMALDLANLRASAMGQQLPKQPTEREIRRRERRPHPVWVTRRELEELLSLLSSRRPEPAPSPLREPVEPTAEQATEPPPLPPEVSP